MVPNSGFKKEKPARNRFTKQFKATFSIPFPVVSGGYLLFVFKICQTVAGMRMFGDYFTLIFGGILLFGPILAPTSGDWRQTLLDLHVMPRIRMDTLALVL